MKKRVYRLMRDRRQHLRGCPNLKPARSQVVLREDALLPRDAFVRPEVASATCEELLAAGWGSYNRHRIPADWRARKPGVKAVPGPVAAAKGPGSAIGATGAPETREKESA